MKIVHAADLHIDSPLRGLARHEGAPVERVRAATRQAFVRVVDLCLEEDARFLVLAGDVFDTDWKDVNTGLFFVNQLVRLRDIGCRVLVLRGNHDFELTRALRWPDHVLEFAPPRASKRDGKRRSFAFDHEGVVFHGVSYPEREVKETLLPEYPEPIDGLLNVGVLHTNATSSSDHAAYAPCTKGDLERKGYGYWALGHVHAHAVLSREPFIVYPGNTQGRHANEPGPKGCVLLHVESGVVRDVEFRDISVVAWCREDIVLSRDDDVDDLHDKVRARLDAIASANEGRLSAVRLTVRGGARAHAAVCRNHAQIVAQIHADALERGELWVEKVELATRPETSIGELRDAKGLVADLLRHVEAIRGDEGDAELLHLARVLDPLEKKLGAELLASGVSLKDPAFLRKVLDEAEALLAQRLTEGSS